MERYRKLFQEAIKQPLKIKGQFGGGGFLAKLSQDEIWDKFGFDTEYVIMDVNMELMDIANSGKPIGKQVDKLDDYRVGDDEVRGKFAIQYPFGVHKSKGLVALYQKLVIKHLNLLVDKR